jgi:carboxypeptidase Taq
MHKSYEKLISHLKNIEHLASILSLLGWDEQVNLPTESASNRAAQLSAMAEICHREKTSPELGKLLKELHSSIDEFNAEQQCVIRHAKKNFDRATNLPSSFVARKASAESRSYHAWVHARKTNDFKSYAPYLQEQLDLAFEEAEMQGYSKNPYDYQIDKHDPDMKAETIADLFNSLKIGLLPILDKIIKSPIKPETEIFKSFPVKDQELFLKEVTEKIGFDYSRGRIDIAIHPFCSGNGRDTRMTTRYDIDNPLDSLFSSIHETGHGLYEQGLPSEHAGTALGEHAGMAVHESQSRIWENQVSRSRSFWKFWEPRFREIFKTQLHHISLEDLYLAINAVSRNPIRVDSDEVTYNLHIILRFELEKKLFDRELKVLDLPNAWNQLSEELLGLKPENDSQGVLQDVHWSGGAFGYFPSYCLGNMMAAQLWYSANEEINDLQNSFEKGNFSIMLKWLNEKIHLQGKRYNAIELTKNATGKALSPDSLIRYLKERYLPLYEANR